MEEQTRGVLRSIVNYVPNVIMDGVDIFQATISVGDGWGADLRCTRLLEMGIDDYDVTQYGLNGRNRPVFAEAIQDGGVGVFGFVFGSLDRDPYEIGGTLQLGVGGIDLSADLYSGLDFLACILFLDLEEDNVNYL
jgi:hypothetical protein